MPRYMWFIIATVALIVGYIIYGAIVSKIFGAQPERQTPAKTMADGVDYVEMPTWKVWLVQLLNIAGVGPVFGPILGALWGPSALIWIVIGTIFAGAVHDYMAGMLSVRYDGANVPTIVGYNLGNIAKQVMRIFAVVLLVLVGVVFVAAPAALLDKLTPEMYTMFFWTSVIFAYYFIATIMPIDKIIGNFYPVFGAVLIFMAVGMTVMMFVECGPEFYNSIDSWTQNTHPKELPIFPLVFITIACGALSGFHATQSPLMARCMANEKLGKPIFYGSMVAEGFIGLVWATVGMTFYHGPDALSAALASGGPAAIVTESCSALLGSFGGVLAILGVVVLPITSGDTAFRAARLTIAEVFVKKSKGDEVQTLKTGSGVPMGEILDQKRILPRLYIAIPMFIIGIILANVDFTIIWRYFGWANQTLATIVLWAGAAYLIRRGRCHWICTVPAVFMTAVITSYICYEPTMGFRLSIDISNIIGIIVAIIAFVAFMLRGRAPVEGAPMNC